MDSTERSLKEYEKDLNIGPSGIGGWLILILIALIIQPLLLVSTIIRINLPIFSDQVAWDILTSPTSEGYIPLFSFLAYYELIGNIIMFIASIALLFLFFQKKKAFPTVYFWFLIFNAVFIIIDEAVADQIFSNAKFMDLDEEIKYKETAKALIGCAIWLPYLKRSKRVKNTFVE